MGRPARQGFSDFVRSPSTLVPVVLGLGSAAVVWGFTNLGVRMAIFLAVVGGLGGLGTLLTQWALFGKSQDPAIAKKRRELLAALDALADGVQRGPTTEADLAAASAPVERA